MTSQVQCAMSFTRCQSKLVCSRKYASALASTKGLITSSIQRAGHKIMEHGNVLPSSVHAHIVDICRVDDMVVAAVISLQHPLGSGPDDICAWIEVCVPAGNLLTIKMSKQPCNNLNINTSRNVHIAQYPYWPEVTRVMC